MGQRFCTDSEEVRILVDRGGNRSDPEGIEVVVDSLTCSPLMMGIGIDELHQTLTEPAQGKDRVARLEDRGDDFGQLTDRDRRESHRHAAMTGEQVVDLL